MRYRGAIRGGRGKGQRRRNTHQHKKALATKRNTSDALQPNNRTALPRTSNGNSDNSPQQMPPKTKPKPKQGGVCVRQHKRETQRTDTRGEKRKKKTIRHDSLLYNHATNTVPPPKRQK